MNYFSEIQNIIDEMNNRLDVSIVLDTTEFPEEQSQRVREISIS